MDASRILTAAALGTGLFFLAEVKVLAEEPGSLGSLKGSANAAAIDALNAQKASRQASAAGVTLAQQSASFDEIQARRNSWASSQLPAGSSPSSNNDGLKWRSAKAVGTAPVEPAAVAKASSATPVADALSNEPELFKLPAGVKPSQLLLMAPANNVAGLPEVCSDCQGEGHAELAGTTTPPAVSPIQTVAYEEETSPFNDPFGDGPIRLAADRRTRPAAPTHSILAQGGAGGGGAGAGGAGAGGAGTGAGAGSQGNAGGALGGGNQPTPAAPLNGTPTPANPAAPRGNQFQPNPLPGRPVDPTQPGNTLPNNPEAPLAPTNPNLRNIDPTQPMGPGPGVVPMPRNGLREEGGDSPAPYPYGNGRTGVEAPPSPSDRVQSKCDRRYNDRDCCEVDRLCDAARLFIHDADIRKISIDITPRFKPDAPSWDEDYGFRDEQLKKADSRAWHDRDGNVIVEGRLLDLASGKAIIRSEDGATRRVSLNVLAEDELCFINGWWNLPSECVAGGLPYAERQWSPATFTYAASGVCHKPLYFEDVQAERYGHVAGPFLQPVLSGAHFFLNIAALPYNMAINPPNECQYALGYYRPGSCAPWMIPPVPLSLRGAIAEAGVIVGGVYLIP